MTQDALHDPIGRDKFGRDPGGEFPREPREGRPVSFYLAIFFGFLLVVSVGLNLLMLVVSAFGSATASLTTTSWDDGAWELVGIGGDEAAASRLLRIPLEGAIAESAAPVIGGAGGSVSSVLGSLALAERDDRIVGVLLEIDSPGGGVTDSDLIWQAVRDFRLRTKKPVVALFGDIAASGGYYVAAACDHIVARPTTITGSIGVIVSNLQFGEAAKKLGVAQEVSVSARTPHKDMMSSFRPMSEDERGILRGIVDELYDRFVDIVAQGRTGLSRERVVELADGRIYSAKQALESGLVDSIGTEDDAWSELGKRAGVSAAQHVERRRRPSLSEILLGASAGEAAPRASLESAVAGVLGGSTGPRLLYWWPGAR
ncbi:MAG: signal peptide peptidase SppA [Planctomycetes bacterium]|nr:signal peptide peptidase SppA [Planctomycetota bacterium]